MWLAVGIGLVVAACVIITGAILYKTIKLKQYALHKARRPLVIDNGIIGAKNFYKEDIFIDASELTTIGSVRKEPIMHDSPHDLTHATPNTSPKPPRTPEHNPTQKLPTEA